MALAKGARQAGATIIEDTEVLSIETTDGRVTAVVTSAGRIACDRVVCCAGQWTRALAATVGVSVPLVSGSAPVHDHDTDRQVSPAIFRRCVTLTD